MATFRWPVDKQYAQPDMLPSGFLFGSKRLTKYPHPHYGVDLGVFGAKVYAAADGVVYTASYINDGLTGYAIYINHEGSWQTRYMHLGPKLLVKSGESVTAGQQIATVGELVQSGKTDAHLHFEIVSNCQTTGCKEGSRLDPLAVLGTAGGEGGKLLAAIAIATAGAVVLARGR